MQDHGFIAFFFQTMLEERFLTKTGMARELDVCLRTLQYNFGRIGLGKGGCMALTNLLLYCYGNGISVDHLYRRYQWSVREGAKGETNMDHSGMLRWIYNYTLKEVFRSDARNMALELRVGENTLQRALEQDECPESLLLFEQLMHYCMTHNSSMDAFLAQYEGKK